MIMRRQQPPEDPLPIWARRLAQRKNRNVAAVAVAAKLACIAWAIAAKNEPYRPRRITPAQRAA